MSQRYPKPSVLSELAGVRHAVIDASAGTGKTYTIEHAVVELVLEGTPLDEILVVTFTEKAAGDLRRRVRQTLEHMLSVAEGERGAPDPEGAEAWILDDQARDSLRAALRGFSGASIHTIHGFCQRVLAEHAFPCGRLFEQELVGGKESFQSAFYEVLRDDLAAPGSPARAELRAWVAAGRDVESLGTLLHDVSACRAELRPRFNPEVMIERLEALREHAGPEMQESLARAVESSKFWGGTKGGVRKAVKRLGQLFVRWDQRRAVLDLVLASKELQIGYLLDDSRRERLSECCPALRPTIEALGKLAGTLVDIPAAAAHLFLAPVQARVRDRKRALGHFDFDDMLSLVRDALVDPQGGQLLTEALRGRYAIALIDEFQDTDTVQWEVFREIFVEGTLTHRLWVIGDPKQAIYAFRGADVFTYLGAVKDLCQEHAAKRVALRQNFRSTPGMIAAYNHLFDQGAQPPFFAEGGIRYDEPVEPGRSCQEILDPAERAPIHLWRFERDEAPRFKAAEVRELLGRQIAREIRRLVTEDRVQVDDVHDGHRPLEWQDVYILTAARWEGEVVAGYLREEGVPFAFYKQEGLFQTAEALHLADVLAAVVEPRDRARRLRAWQTPFFGLTLQELADCRELQGEHPLIRQLLRWHRLAERADYEALFRGLVSDSGLARRELFLKDDERALTNYLHILELLLEEAGRSRRSLRELVHVLRGWIDESSAPGGESGNVQRLEAEHQAVQIMTMHKSKGLEAQIVFVFGGLSDGAVRQLNRYHEPGEEEAPDLSVPLTRAHSADGTRVVHIGELDAEAALQVQAEQRQERRRLLYVALTRACGRLYLPAFGRHPKQDRDGTVQLDSEGAVWQEWDFPYLGGVYGELCGRLFDVVNGETEADPGLFSHEHVSTVDPRPLAPEAVAACRDWRPSDELLQAAPTQDLSVLREARAGRVRVSYSRLKAYEESLALPEKPKPEARSASPKDELELPPTSASTRLQGGTETGSHLHLALELLPYESLESTPRFADWKQEPAVSAAFRRAGFEYPLAPDQAEAAQRVVYDVLRSPLSVPGAELACGLRTRPQALRELEFNYPIPEGAAPPLIGAPGERLQVSRGYVRGIIDLVFRAEGRAYALDWKGDRLPGYGPTRLRERVEGFYLRQRDFYLLALVKLLQIRDEADYEARCGGIVYAFLRAMSPESPAPRGIYAYRPSWSRVQKHLQELRDDPTLEALCPHPSA